MIELAGLLAAAALLAALITLDARRVGAGTGQPVQRGRFDWAVGAKALAVLWAVYLLLVLPRLLELLT